MRPEYTKRKYNFSVFPTSTPTGILDANISNIRNCTDVIKPCDIAIGCAACGDDFECTPIADGENVVVNGQILSPGNWCLPKGKTQLDCGTYTGRSVWSERNESGSLNQKWSCVCLYPSLFGGDDCLTQLACTDSSLKTIDQSASVLKSSDGHIWDPNDPNFNPLGRTPYDKDAEGNPLYTCSCTDSENIKFVTMPYDPYRCHADPCTPSHQLGIWDADKQQCDCTKIAKNQFAHSNVTGQCLDQEKICTWDDDNNICNCSSDEISFTCQSNTMTRPAYTADPCPDNPGGSYCSNPCKGPGGDDICTNGGSCVIDGSTFKCKCHDTDSISYSGDRCEKSCVKDNVVIKNNSPDICCSRQTWSEDLDTNPPQIRYYCGKQSGSCIGASTCLITTNGKKYMGDLKPGDKVLTWNMLAKKCEYQSLLCSYHHNYVPEPHYEIKTAKDRIVLTAEHRIYLADGRTIQAQEIKLEDKLLTIYGEFSPIISIKMIQDIPLTPVLLQGNVITSQGNVLRCWSGTEENANLMDMLVKSIDTRIKQYNAKKGSDFIQKIYTKFSENRKDKNYLLKLANKYNIILSEKITFLL